MSDKLTPVGASLPVSQESDENLHSVEKSTHLPECPCAHQSEPSNHWHEHGAACEGCICDRLRACELRVRTEPFDVAYLAGLDAAEQALLRLEADMRNWSSDETRAATSASPELTAGNWIWAQRGVGRSVQIIRALKGKP